jgi:hypothetical protein
VWSIAHAEITPNAAMKARDMPRAVSRSRTSGARLIANTRLTKLTKTMKDKELVRLTKNSACTIRRITERSKERCGRGGICWSKAHLRVCWADDRISRNQVSPQ